ncbi:hypothetical protein K3495_g14537 [Podosphaera aphanis]|nr:hypothetical protein K3495_g14537 [Podosphaera aphanis]
MANPVPGNTPESMDTDEQDRLPTQPPEITMNQLYNQMLLIQQQFNQQSVVVQNQYQLIEEQKTQISTLREQLHSNSAPVNDSATKVIVKEPVREKLPILEKFSGNKLDWDEWHLAAKHKLTKDGSAIGNKFDLFTYIFSRLEGSASRLVSSHASMLTDNKSGDGWEFLKYLDTIFGDSNKRKKAVQLLFNVKQKEKESFSKFLAKFETILVQAGWSTNPDEQKIELLTNALSHETRTALLGSSAPTTWPEFVCHVQSVSNDVVAINHKFPTLPTSRNTSSQSGDNDTMDWEPIKSPSIQRLNVGKGKRATWVSKEILDYRRQKKLCVRCGNKGHSAKGCRLLPPLSPSTKINTVDIEEDLIDLHLAQPDSMQNEELKD